MEKEPNKYHETELPELDGDILVLVGRTKFPLPGYPLTPIPFCCGCYEERGVVTRPECVFDEEKGIFNDNYNLVCNCEAMVRDGFHGVILTNSQYVVDAVEVYARLYGRHARFFMADRETETIIEYTDDMERIYKSFIPAIDKLEEDRDKFESFVDKIAEGVGAKAKEAIGKNPAAVAALRGKLLDASESIASEAPAPSFEVTVAGDSDSGRLTVMVSPKTSVKTINN